MRIHSNILERHDIYDAMYSAKYVWRVAQNVFVEVKEHGSRSHKRAFEVRLVSYSKEQGDGRRMQEPGRYSATYDEWGWFLSELYGRDPQMVCKGAYVDSQDFDEKTGFTYNPTAMMDYLANGEDPAPYVLAQPKVGRYGAGRICEAFATTTQIRLSEYAPRELVDYMTFAYPKGKAA